MDIWVVFTFNAICFLSVLEGSVVTWESLCVFVGGMDLCMSVCGVHLHVVAFGRHSFVLHSATKVIFLKLSVLLRACNGALSPLGSPCGLHDQPQAPPLFSSPNSLCASYTGYTGAVWLGKHSPTQVVWRGFNMRNDRHVSAEVEHVKWKQP